MRMKYTTAVIRCFNTVFCHRDVPGYTQLCFLDRLCLDFRSLRLFFRSVESLRLALWLTAWILAGYLLIFHWDVQGVAACWPLWSAALLALLRCAVLRRRYIDTLLNSRWPS